MYGLIHAPELTAPGLHWLNVESPPRLKDHRGRLVILDFWTSCCINCHHVLPTLKRIEDTFADRVTVIGIHSPKFEAERDPGAVSRALERLNVHHAVALDTRFALWQAYCVKAWPTLVFIGPDGHIVGSMSGEPDPEKLIDGIAAMLHSWPDAPAACAPRAPTTPKEPKRRLRFPGKIKPVTLPNGEPRWAVADSGHHQVVLFDDDGNETRRFGCGVMGLKDGPGDEARFNTPQGLCGGEGVLWVADTNNHALRVIDLNNGSVRTVAGTGRRGTALEYSSAPSSLLASPWDVTEWKGRVIFANAGTHQLGLYDPALKTVHALAGSSIEGIMDGPATDAQLAQPSGLALSPDESRLAFVDAETSSVRLAHLDQDSRIETLIGTGLFDFGHVNGPFAESVLQHPLGVCWEDDSTLIVADSYNNTLRRLDLTTRSCHDVQGGAFALGNVGGEPIGVWRTPTGSYRATDTNNHRIVDITPQTGTFRIWVE